MKKRGKVALYNPYLDTLGGGEKHILSILKVLEDNDFDLTIFWDENLQDDIKNRLNLSFDYVINFQPNIFKKKGLLNKLGALKKFDYFFYVTDGSYFFSSATNNFVFCMVPDQKLYKVGGLTRLKTANYQFLANSKFTQSWLKKWGLSSKVVYPYVDSRLINKVIDLDKKEKLILSVGRFFGHLHSKKQEVIISAFKELKKNPKFKDYRLVLAGGLKDEDKKYFASLKKEVGNDKSISLLSNVSYDELFELYEKAKFYWHFTGYGVNEERSPQSVEHFGITPLEAMAMECLTFCYNAGGPKEYIQDGKNGYLFNDVKGLTNKILKVLTDNKTSNVAKAGKETVRAKFSYSALRKNVEELILKNK